MAAHDGNDLPIDRLQVFCESIGDRLVVRASKDTIEHVFGGDLSGFFPMQVNGGVGRLTVGARVVPIKASEEFFRRVEMRTKGVVGSILKMGKDDATASLDVGRPGIPSFGVCNDDENESSRTTWRLRTRRSGSGERRRPRGKSACARVRQAMVSSWGIFIFIAACRLSLCLHVIPSLQRSFFCHCP